VQTLWVKHWLNWALSTHLFAKPLSVNSPWWSATLWLVPVIPVAYVGAFVGDFRVILALTNAPCGALHILSSPTAGTEALSLGVSKAGATEPYRPFGDDAVAYPADRSFDLTPWRNGVALATVAGTPEARLLVGVTDGEHTTVLPISSDAVSFCDNGLSVVSSPDGNSIYLGYLHCPPDESRRL
jgi:hypothetical protein